MRVLGAVGPSQFYEAGFVQKMAVWYKTKMNASDQFRHRAAMALANVFVVTQTQVCTVDLCFWKLLLQNLVYNKKCLPFSSSPSHSYRLTMEIFGMNSSCLMKISLCEMPSVTSKIY